MKNAEIIMPTVDKDIQLEELRAMGSHLARSYKEPIMGQWNKGYIDYATAAACLKIRPKFSDIDISRQYKSNYNNHNEMCKSLGDLMLDAVQKMPYDMLQYAACKNLTMNSFIDVTHNFTRWIHRGNKMSNERIIQLVDFGFNRPELIAKACECCNRHLDDEEFTTRLALLILEN